MRRYELEHIIRAASAITQQTEFVIVGSQAILGKFPHAKSELLVSMEADIFPLKHPELAEEIDGTIGERSMFHISRHKPTTRTANSTIRMASSKPAKRFIRR